MGRKPVAAAVVLLALAPAVYFAWTAREMPHFGHLHDDSIYWVSAKSLAQGRGYRIASLPAEPFETKYPPLWPVVLAGVWKLKPNFPENLKLGLVLSLLMLPAVLALAWRWYRAAGLGTRTAAVLALALGFSPCVVFLSTTPMCDMAFTALVLAAILAIRRAAEQDSFALPAGLLAAACYLVKTGGLPLIAAGPLWLALRRKYRSAAVFACAMLPAVVWWSLWSRAHMSRSWDLVSLYYTNYVGYQIYNVGWPDLPLVMWKNLDGVFSGIAGLMIYGLDKTVWGMHLARLLAIGAIGGTVRLAFRRGMTAYHWFAAGYTAVLLVWHFPPNERFILPVFPLFAAGFASEALGLGSALRNAWKKGAADRAVAVVMAAGCAGFVCLWGVSNARTIFRQFPDIVGQHRAVLASNRAAFGWIARHTDAGAFYAYDDPVFYLYTGRHASSLPVAPIAFYRGDHERVLAPFREMPEFARAQHLDYVLLTAADFHRDLPDDIRAEVRRILTGGDMLEKVYQSPLSAIYKVKDTAALRVAASRQPITQANHACQRLGSKRYTPQQ